MTEPTQPQSPQGLVIVLTGPSGAGKDTLRIRYLERHPETAFSVSATTRQPRPGERDGVDYHFISRDEFERRVGEGRFLEWAEYTGNCYGTLLDPVRETLREGRDIILVIEVQGAAQVRKKLPQALFVFVMPPSWEELKRRLEKRDTERGEQMEARLRRARQEIDLIGDFDFVVINDDLDDGVAALEKIRAAAPFMRARREEELRARGFLHD